MHFQLSGAQESDSPIFVGSHFIFAEEKEDRHRQESHD
jgi:urease beta subunit